MTQKKLTLILTVVAAVFAVLAVVLLVFGIIYDGAYAFTQIFMIVSGVLCFALAGELVFLSRFAGKNEAPNYFLFDSSAKKNISADKLTPTVVHNRMNKYISAFAPSEGKLWTDGILESDELDMDDAFKPLVAYKLLFDLAEWDIEKGWKCFENASFETVDFVCSCLEMNNELEVAGNIRKMKQVRPFNVKYIRDYLVSNKGYLQTKMLMYVRENLEEFE